MELAGYLVNAVVLEHRPVAEVARAYGVSRSWLYELLGRHRQLGEAAFVARSRRPKSSPNRVPPAIEDEIVALRKSLAEDGLDAGPTPSSTTYSYATGAAKPLSRRFLLSGGC